MKSFFQCLIVPVGFLAIGAAALNCPFHHPTRNAIVKPTFTAQGGRMTKYAWLSMRTPTVLSYKHHDNAMNSTIPFDRFQREATKTTELEQSCILTIHDNRYNMTAWANAHPGGAKILQKFNNRDASKAFEAAHHSPEAYAMLKDFLIKEDKNAPESDSISIERKGKMKFLRRARHKLFTKEDPIGFHKYLGIFCLLNFIGRYSQMYFGDPAAGLGTRGHPWFAIACLIPHGLLSVSSLLFDTVPKERVVGKPMIWQEFRAHNIIFGVRSVLAALAASLAIKAGNGPVVRKLAIGFSGLCILLANYGADLATEKLRVSEVDSTTATMPYWEGCSVETQKRFKSFYAYCQFMATLACLAVANPAWPLAVLVAIQLASLLMTLVRKGLLSARGYHYGYTATLIAPWFVGLRTMAYTKSPDFALIVVFGYLLYQLRRRGVNKYLMWTSLIATRLVVGDNVLDFAAW